LERIPLFVRGGSVVPLGPPRDYVDGCACATTLHVYPDPATAETCSWLYEDDGESTAHRSGDYRLTRFTLAMHDGRLILRRQAEGPFDPGYSRWEIVIHGVEAPPVRGACFVHEPPGVLRASAGLFDELTLEW